MSTSARRPKAAAMDAMVITDTGPAATPEAENLIKE